MRVRSGEHNTYTSSRNANNHSPSSNDCRTSSRVFCMPKLNNRGMRGSPCSPALMLLNCVSHSRFVRPDVRQSTPALVDRANCIGAQAASTASLNWPCECLCHESTKNSVPVADASDTSVSLLEGCHGGQHQTAANNWWYLAPGKILCCFEQQRDCFLIIEANTKHLVRAPHRGRMPRLTEHLEDNRGKSCGPCSRDDRAGTPRLRVEFP